eukprot:scaffold81933_cov28-Tisochrysis_lutea.AAC.7
MRSMDVRLAIVKICSKSCKALCRASNPATQLTPQLQRHPLPFRPTWLADCSPRRLLGLEQPSRRPVSQVGRVPASRRR